MYGDQTVSMVRAGYDIYSVVESECFEGRRTAKIMTEGILLGLSAICPDEVNNLTRDPAKLGMFHNLIRLQMWLNESIDDPSEETQEKFEKTYEEYRVYENSIVDKSIPAAVKQHLNEIMYFESPQFKQTVIDYEKYRIMVDCASISTFTTLLFGPDFNDFIEYASNPKKYEHMYVPGQQSTFREKVEYILLSLVMASQICDDRYGYYQDRKAGLPTSFTHFLDICNQNIKQASKMAKSVEKIYYKRALDAGLEWHLVAANSTINIICQKFIKELDKYSTTTSNTLRPSRKNSQSNFSPVLES